jgi:SAM-dependent methyltransferase
MSVEYIHGFTATEQHRLVEQANVLAPNVFAGLDFSGVTTLLEIGCAVGAELDILHRQWPHLELTGLDRSASHLAAAGKLLATGIEGPRAALVRGDAYLMPFAEESFDCVITIWMLEHTTDPVRVIRNALRLLRPKGRLICTEVDNATFGFEPRSEVIAHWWDWFNDYQRSAGGDPFVGRKLEEIARRAGCRDLRVERVYAIDSKRDATRRRVLLDYLEELLLSGAENMIKEEFADERDAARVKSEFARLRDNEAVDFRYYATRLTCRP